MAERRSTRNRFLITKDGRRVVAQRPNAAIILALLGFATNWFVPGRLGELAWWFGWGALIYWSVMEVKDGVNHFRRLLGAAVGILALVIAISKTGA